MQLCEMCRRPANTKSTRRELLIETDIDEIEHHFTLCVHCAEAIVRTIEKAGGTNEPNAR